MGDDVVTLLALGAAQHSTLYAELDRIADNDPDPAVRDRAQGLLASMNGKGLPQEEARQWLADAAAQAFDDTPMFPNPLTPLARTRPGAIDLEETLCSTVRQAMQRFADHAKDFGAVAIEEQLTTALLNELEFAFRSAKLRLVSGSRAPLSRMISVNHRPTHKGTEEPFWGCDVALVLDADLRPDARIEMAELVQVKKSKRFAKSASVRARESWSIDIAQLTTLLGRSQSSVYWLLLATGKVVCVPAQWILGLVKGSAKPGRKSVTVGHNQIRHAAVPMEQFTEPSRVAELITMGWNRFGDAPGSWCAGSGPVPR